MHIKNASDYGKNSTERPETLMIGCNILSKIRKNRIFKDAQIILNRKINWSNPYGDGKSSYKILNIINTIKKKCQILLKILLKQNFLF